MFDRLYRHGRLVGIGLAAALLNACGGGSATAPDTEPFYLEEEDQSGALVWSDEFDGSCRRFRETGLSNWVTVAITGLPGWGNYELQYYQADNASIARRRRYDLRL